MLIREVTESERAIFDRVATHPLQSWAWGEFRKKTGVKVERLGAFSGKAGLEGKLTLKAGYQVTIHAIPRTGYNIGYFPKGTMPDDTQLKALRDIGEKNNCLLVKLEPNVGRKITDIKTDGFATISQYLLSHGCTLGRPLFTKYSWQIDLTQDETSLLAKMKPKTRYNINLAQKRGVVMTEDNSLEAWETYLKLTQETTRRQRFYSHTPEYHRLMWKEMNKAGIAHLLTATWQGKILVTWIVFEFNGVLYYPYGASSSQYRELMASNLMMWEAIKLGKKLGCKTLDMWGALGPNPNPRDPWYGFHRFKEGYGGDLMEFLGTYDLVLKPQLYKLYRMAEEARWMLLRAKTWWPIR